MSKVQFHSKIKRVGLALIALALLIPMMAFAKGLSGIDISGPGIDGTMHLSDLDEMEDIMQSGFFDMSSYVRLSDDEIKALGMGYEITFYFSEEPGADPFHMEKVVYYPDPEGGRGYIHWLGGGDAGVEIMPNSQWSRVNTAGENTFWQVMEAHQVIRPEVGAAAAEAVVSAEVVEGAANVSQAVEPPAAESLAINWTWIAAAVAVVLISAVAGVWLIRQRQDHSRVESAAASD